MNAIGRTLIARTLPLLAAAALTLIATLPLGACGKKEAPPAAEPAAPSEAAPAQAQPEEGPATADPEDKEPIQPTAAELETYTKEAEKEITADNVKEVAARLAAEIDGEVGRGAPAAERGTAPAGTDTPTPAPKAPAPAPAEPQE